jgi:hypothetical protein
MGVLNRKLSEFLDLKLGSMTVMEYANKFNHLAQYAGTHVDTDEKKRYHYYCDLSYILQKELYTRNYQTFSTLMNAAIAMEGLQCDTQAEWKRKRGISRSSSHPQALKMQVVKRMSYHSPGGSRLGSLSRLARHYRLSTVHLLSRCSSHRDNNFHLARGSWSSLLLVSSVARKVTLLGSISRTGLLSLPSRSPTLA